MIERKRNYYNLEFDTQKKCQTILNTSSGIGNKKIFLYIFDMFPYMFISVIQKRIQDVQVME